MYLNVAAFIMNDFCILAQLIYRIDQSAFRTVSTRCIIFSNITSPALYFLVSRISVARRSLIVSRETDKSYSILKSWGVTQQKLQSHAVQHFAHSLDFILTSRCSPAPSGFRNWKSVCEIVKGPGWRWVVPALNECCICIIKEQRAQIWERSVQAHCQTCPHTQIPQHCWNQSGPEKQHTTWC